MLISVAAKERIRAYMKLISTRQLADVLASIHFDAKLRLLLLQFRQDLPPQRFDASRSLDSHQAYIL